MNEAPKVEAASSQQPEPTFKRWDYGDLQLTCSHCGHSEVVEKGIKDGLQFVLPTTDEHKLKLTCSKCGVTLLMNFKESEEDTKKESQEKFEAWEKEQVEAKANAAAKANNLVEKAEEVIEEQDALLQEDSKEETVQDDN